MRQTNHPVMTRDQAVLNCKKYAEEIRDEGIDTIVFKSEKDKYAYVGMTDVYAYPLDVQEWITPDEEPLLYALSVYIVRVDVDPTDRKSWEKILQLADILE